jgi:hypothetical protein
MTWPLPVSQASLQTMSGAVRTRDEIFEQAKRLSPEERRLLAEELLAGLERAEASHVPAEGAYAEWLDAAGGVRSDHNDLSTEKYKHVAASAHGHDKA